MANFLKFQLYIFPLDQGIFHLVKADMKRTKSSLSDLNTQSKRIFSVLRSFSRYCNQYDCTSSFRNFVILVNGVNHDNPLYFNIWVIYKKKMCPMQSIDLEKTEKKRKLIKLDSFEVKRRKRKKKNEKDMNPKRKKTQKK